MLGGLLTACLFAAPPAVGAEAAGGAIGVRTAGIPASALERELRLRIPGREVVDLGASGGGWPREDAWAVVLVEPRGAAFAVTVVLSDGRAFDRAVEADAEQAPRAVAAALANLLAAIAEDRVEADRADVRIDVGVAGAGEEEAPPAAAPAPDLTPPEPEPAPAPASALRAEPPPRWALGVHVGGAAILGLGPPEVDRALVAGGGGVGAVARSPGGALVGVDGRFAGGGVSEARLLRGRIAAIGGYGLRRGRFALDVAAVVAVEPWSARVDGAAAAVVDGEREAPQVALGAGARVVPALLVAVGRGVRLGVGVAAELGYAGVVDAGLRAVRLTLPRPAAEDARLRLGGVEASVGVDVALHFELAPRRARAGPGP